MGKTALLDYLARGAAGCRVVRVLGMQSEMELAFAGLHQLCSPMLHGLGGLPVPQRKALRTAFGLSVGRNQIGSWSGWPCSACSRTWPGIGS